MININKLKIDNSVMGKLILLEVRKSYQYENGKKTDIPKGISYVVASTGLALEKFSILIETNDITIEFDNDSKDFSNIVEFEELQAFPYIINGNVGIKAIAKSVRLINQNTKGSRNENQ